MLVTFTPPLPQGEGTTVLGSDGCSYTIKGGCPIVAAPIDIDTVDGYSLPGIAPEGVTDSNTGEPIEPGAQVTVYFGPDGNIIGYKDCTDADTFATTVIATDAGTDDANNDYPAGATLLMTPAGELFCMSKTPGSMLIVAGADGTDDADNPYSQGDQLIQLSDGNLVCAEKPDELGPSVIVNPDDPSTFPADSGIWEKRCLRDADGNMVGYVDATGPHFIQDDDDEVGPDVPVDPDDPGSWPTAPASPHAVQFLCDQTTGVACAILTAGGAKEIPKPKNEVGPDVVVVNTDDASTWPALPAGVELVPVCNGDGELVGLITLSGPKPIGGGCCIQSELCDPANGTAKITVVRQLPNGAPAYYNADLTPFVGDPTTLVGCPETKPCVDLIKRHNPAIEPVVVGDVVTYEYCVLNPGVTDLVSVSIEDDVLGTIDTSSLALPMAPGNKQTVTADYPVTDDSPSPLVNIAVVSASDAFGQTTQAMDDDYVIGEPPEVPVAMADPVNDLADGAGTMASALSYFDQDGATPISCSGWCAEYRWVIPNCPDLVLTAEMKDGDTAFSNQSADWATYIDPYLSNVVLTGNQLAVRLEKRGAALNMTNANPGTCNVAGTGCPRSAAGGTTAQGQEWVLETRVSCDGAVWSNWVSTVFPIKCEPSMMYPTYQSTSSQDGPGIQRVLTAVDGIQIGASIIGSAVQNYELIMQGNLGSGFGWTPAGSTPLPVNHNASRVSSAPTAWKDELDNIALPGEYFVIGHRGDIPHSAYALENPIRFEHYTSRYHFDTDGSAGNAAVRTRNTGGNTTNLVACDENSMTVQYIRDEIQHGSNGAGATAAFGSAVSASYTGNTAGTLAPADVSPTYVGMSNYLEGQVYTETYPAPSCGNIESTLVHDETAPDGYRESYLYLDMPAMTF